jgi:hypothetical protein
MKLISSNIAPHNPFYFTFCCKPCMARTHLPPILLKPLTPFLSHQRPSYRPSAPVTGSAHPARHTLCTTDTPVRRDPGTAYNNSGKEHRLLAHRPLILNRLKINDIELERLRQLISNDLQDKEIQKKPACG